MKNLSIYIHIPFCIKKCNYCDFLSAPADEETKKRYVDRLLEEMKEASGAYCEYEVVSVFFGGGTPSVLAGEDTGRIMELLKKKFRIRPDAEITTEVNPKTASYEKLKTYFDLGLNRLSIGLQSAEEKELAVLGRIHGFQDFCETFRSARRVGFSNINVDIMSALPGQSVESYRNTLKKTLLLSPEHISAYSLIIEEGTPFYEQYGKEDAIRQAGGSGEIHDKKDGLPPLPSEETEREMYEETERLLREYGYRRYEISNYAKPGYECIHNTAYWTRKEYIGFGIGAASYTGGVRFKNSENLQDYLAGDFKKAEKTVLKKTDCMEEFMFLGLRMIKGVSKQEFLTQFGVSMEAVYDAALRKTEGQGLLKTEGDRVFLTHKGLDVANYVMAEFLF